MSDAKREWRFYIDDMIAFGECVLAYTSGMDQSAFVANTLVFDATVRNLELIGEAATHVPGDVRRANPQVPWRMVIATRNRLIHAYLGIDHDTLWSIVITDAPALLPRPVGADRARRRVVRLPPASRARPTATSGPRPTGSRTWASGWP